MRVFIAVLTVSLVVPLSNLSAQQLSRLEGARMRVTAPDCGMSKMTTTLEALRGDTLLFPGQPTRSSNPIVPVKCPWASVTRLEVSAGRARRTGRGALIGCGAGAVAGLITGWLWCHGLEGSALDCGDPANGIVIGGIPGGAVGAGIGAIIGALIKTDRWEEVPLHQLRVSLAPQRDGWFTLGVLLRF